MVSLDQDKRNYSSSSLIGDFVIIVDQEDVVLVPKDAVMVKLPRWWNRKGPHQRLPIRCVRHPLPNRRRLLKYELAEEVVLIRTDYGHVLVPCSSNARKFL